VLEILDAEEGPSETTRTEDPFGSGL
jgi:hypothetical protein